MDWDIEYLLQNCIVTFCALIFIPAFMIENKNIEKKVKKYFAILLVITAVEGIESYVDHVLSHLDDSTYETLRVAVSVIGYCARPLMLYMVLLIITRRSTFKYKNLLLLIPSLVTIVVALMALVPSIGDYIFFYDERNVFHGGPGRNVFFIALAVYYVLIALFTFLNRKNSARETRILIGILALLLLDTVLAFVFNSIYVHQQITGITLILYFMYFSSLSHKKEVDELTTSILDQEAALTRQMLDQSIETLAFTIDAKDRYTRGHSFRVAKYARQIAKLDGESEEYCRQIYMAGLLHDIGKISVKNDVINKNGRLTDEEYQHIKKHPAMGANILKKMIDFPFLVDGANFHHERYDGTGYPVGLKGDEIPKMARIIAVADSYDAMTSHRSYRNTMDQAIVKQEIWKGMGTQFDPYYAKLMISLIDADANYDMREKEDTSEEIMLEDDDTKVSWEFVPKKIQEDNILMQETTYNTLGEFACGESDWANPLPPLKITESPDHFTFISTTDPEAEYIWYAPTAIVYSSKNGEIGGKYYDELSVFESSGYSWRVGSALREDSKITRTENFHNWDEWMTKNKQGMKYQIFGVRHGSQVKIKIQNDLLIMEGIVTLPEGFNKNVYVTASGRSCELKKF